MSIPYSERRKIEVKVLPEFYEELRMHRKTFEIRKDDRDYQVGDILVLREWNGKEYTGSKTGTSDDRMELHKTVRYSGLSKEE